MSGFRASSLADAEDPSRVEVDLTGELVRVRDGSDPGEVLWFTREEWAQFLAGVRAGEFDVDEVSSVQ